MAARSGPSASRVISNSRASLPGSPSSARAAPPAFPTPAVRTSSQRPLIAGLPARHGADVPARGLASVDLRTSDRPARDVLPLRLAASDDRCGAAVRGSPCTRPTSPPRSWARLRPRARPPSAPARSPTSAGDGHSWGPLRRNTPGPSCPRLDRCPTRHLPHRARPPLHTGFGRRFFQNRPRPPSAAARGTRARSGRARLPVARATRREFNHKYIEPICAPPRTVAPLSSRLLSPSPFTAPS